MSEIEPVKVHIASSDVPAPQPRRRERAVTFYTLVLTSDQPVMQVLRPDPNRVCAYVQAAGKSVVLAKSKGDAQANTSDTTYANPAGALLPAGNTAPTPLETTGEVWAGAADYPAQVSVIVVTEM